MTLINNAHVKFMKMYNARVIETSYYRALSFKMYDKIIRAKFIKIKRAINYSQMVIKIPLFQTLIKYTE